MSRVQYVHSRGWLHRDIKPDNFAMGLGQKQSEIHILDFGLSRQYRDPETGLHIPYKNGKNLTGTARYASVNTHLGVEQSRRDDLEGLCYVFMYFLRGSLPWQGLAAHKREDKYKEITQIKMATTPAELCHGFPSTPPSTCF